MPIYTYRCENCGIQFEKHQNFSDQPLIRCPECSKDALRKVYLPVGIVFKGSGFYATDNRSPSGATRTKDGRPTDSDKSDNGDKTEKVAADKNSDTSKNESSKSSNKTE
jgi:putative FmdB family regulatory protein